VRALVVRLKRARAMGYTTARVLVAISEQLEARGAGLYLVGLRPRSLAVLKESGAVEQIGRAHIFAARPGWFQAMDAALHSALAATNAPNDSPLRRYLATHDASRCTHPASEE